jgi:hypothetical protein
MSSLRFVCGAIGIAILLVSRAIWVETAVAHTAGPGIHDVDTTAVSDPMWPDEAPMYEQEAARRVDVYGNEIETAVGDYRIDLRGDVYERHSPETALPDLSSPGT